MEKHLNATSIKRQLQVIFGFSIVMVLVSSYASYYSNQKLIEASKWVNHTNEVIKEADNIISVMKDAETGQRGFILTRDSIFLQPYFGAAQTASNGVARLKALTSDNAKQQARIAEMKPLIDEKFTQMQNILFASLGKSEITGLNTVTIDYPAMLQGKKIMDDVRRKCNEIKDEENKLLKFRTGEQEDYISHTPIFILIASLISVIVSLLAYARIKNDIDQRVEQQRKDEEKYRETARRIAVMETVTRRLSVGDYSARSEDELKDELGKIATALNEMGVALEKNFNELERRNWFQTGSVDLAMAMRGERFVKNLSEKIVGSLARYLNAPLGTLYITDPHMNLRFSGGYAVQHVKKELAEGEGLVGQAIKDRKIIVVKDLPADYMRVSSSSGNTRPSHLVLFPLVYNNDPVGVVELGFFSEPTSQAITFLENNTEAIAIAINSAISYEKMQNLLEETQAQAEELQAQHNEMESLNVELETQTEKLQASEEELKVQQEELLEANTELEEKARLLEEKNMEIAEKNKDMLHKAEQLALSAKYKSEFLANMSHELRTPLNSILLLSRLLKENNEENLSEDQVEYARVIQSSGNGLLALIDEILDLSKIEAGKMELEREPVSIQGVLENMSAMFAPVAKDRNVELKVSAEGDMPASIDSDKLRLEQVLKNLLSNALKFTTQGYVSLTIKPYQQKEGWISFEVQDTGIGIPKDKQQLIFEAFQQADGSTRRKYGGTGLGLSISRELVKLLGGELTLESSEGKGSCFSMLLPVSAEYNKGEDRFVLGNENLAPMPATAAIADRYTTNVIPENIPDDRQSVKAGDKIILIIEDDINFAKSLLTYTRGKGYKGIVAVRGDEGLQLASQYMPAGILLDIVLPVKNGWQVIEELKNDSRLRHIPVHIMSSYSVKKESMLKGAVNFIDKPVAAEQMQEIFSKLEHILNRDTKKVLIVEDNPKHARALAYFLETFNIPSEVKNSVDDSIKALSDDGADCVILDMGIPDQKGYDILDKVKKTPSLENLPVIIFTGKSLSMAEEQRIKKYADSIVVKTAHSYQRMLDEVSIFLHVVEEKSDKKKGGEHKKLGALNDVLGGRTVLIVDDDVRNIFSLTKALEKFGMNIVTAIDGKEAMVKMNEHKEIDIVLLDMMMPEMDGYETATAIRQNRAWKDLPVIAVTAKAMMGDRDKCIKAGASDYVTKPVDVDQLVSLLRVWLYERM